MMEFFENLKYIQDHGGIMITVALCFVFALILRTVDLFRLREDIKNLERRAVDRTATHELHWHLENGNAIKRGLRQ